MARTLHLASRIEGCLLGGAVGDALGAPFEGLWAQSIPAEDELLAGYAEYEGFPRGQYTDDTQLTLATVASIVGLSRVDGNDIARRFAELWPNQIIGPGGACTIAVQEYRRTGDWKTCGAEPGSAGNGTAMRTACLGPLFVKHPRDLPGVVASVSRITHQDSRSVAGGVAIAEAARLIAGGGDWTPADLCEAVASAIEGIEPDFAAMVSALPSLARCGSHDARLTVARAGRPHYEFGDQVIITPYVVSTVLAALWSVIEHPGNWGRAVTSAIHWGGDVDTLGAIVGSLVGLNLGAAGIPDHLCRSLVGGRAIRKLAGEFGALLERGLSRQAWNDLGAGLD